MSLEIPSAPPMPHEAFLLANGTSLVVRPLRPDDHDDVLGLHARASEDSIYKRFFSLHREGARLFVEAICKPREDTFSLVALRHGRVVGIATAVGADRAEVALLVEESLHGVGIGSVLLEQLAREGRHRGVRVFTAEVLTRNAAMLRVFHDLGFDLEQQRDHEVLSLAMDLTLSSAAVAASDARLRHSRAMSLRQLFEPASVVVVGVSRRRGSIGREVLENLLAAGFAGSVMAVGRPGLSVAGAVCVTSLESLPRDLGLAVVAVPSHAVEGTVRALAGQGTRCCVILTSGLAESGDAGAETQRRLTDVAREHDMRLVGPNCFGVLSNLRTTRLDGTFGTARPQQGTLAVGSQSGGVGIALLDAARARGLGVASFVSLGNKADVSGKDLVSAWYDDPDVHAGALYLESFHDPRSFARLATGFSRTKPLLVVFGGSSAAGVRAGASHTAAHATPSRALQALYRASGVIAAEDLDDLVDTAALLTEQPVPRGARLGVLSNAGGLGILAADAAQHRQLALPELSSALRDDLRTVTPDIAGVSNPVDLGAAATPEAFGRAARGLASSGEVDALLVIIVATAVSDLAGSVEAVESALEEAPDLPCLSVVVGGLAPTRRTTRFRSTDAAVRSLAHALRWAAWRRTAERQLCSRAEAVRSEDVFPSPSSRGAATWLDVDDAGRLLEPTGITLAPYAVARTTQEITAAVRWLGLPVVVKSADPSAVHKTETKQVLTNLTSLRQVLDAVRSIREAAGDPQLPVLVQKQLSGPELAYGLVRDPTFGPLIMVSSGGTQLDLWDDQVFLLPPTDPDEVASALSSLRTWPLLTGFRGSQVLDATAVVEQVVALGRLALERPDLLELDLNPVVVTPSGPRCVDAKVRVRSVDDDGDGTYVPLGGTVASAASNGIRRG